jgi:type I restriction enzyme, S subunit
VESGAGVVEIGKKSLKDFTQSMNVTYKASDLMQAGKLAIGDGYRAKNSELAKTGVPFARAGNINDGFNFHNADFFPIDKLNKIGDKVSRYGDVVFTSKGTVGRFAFVLEKTQQFVFSPQLCFWRSLDWEVINPRFLYYWINSQEFWEQAAGVKGQTDMADYVNLTDQRRFTITLPEIENQRAIARILGALDDKIDLNRQMNHTLEQMAQALYKSWFVDFDPVAAKAAGKKPFGISDEIANLFPDRFVESEMGMIPEGWKIGTIKDRVSRIQYGLTESATNEPVGPKFLRITDIQGGKVAWNCVPYCKVDNNSLEKYRINIGDIFVARTGASTGENVFIVSPPDAVFASYLVRFQFRKIALSRFVAQFMRSQDYFEYISCSLSGSAQPNANAQTLASAKLLFPSDELIEIWYNIVSHYDNLIAANSQNNTDLSKFRDLLLPRLLSGEIRIKHAEKLVAKEV